MARQEVLQYREVVNQFLKVGTATSLQTLKAGTYTTAAGSTTLTVPVAELGGIVAGIADSERMWASLPVERCLVRS